MTREEAIKRLKEYAAYSYGIWRDEEEDTKAFDMAIEALSKEPKSGDSISRQALIDEITEDGNGAVLSYPAGIYEDELVELIEKQMIQHFIGVIEYAPPVEPKQSELHIDEPRGYTLKTDKAEVYSKRPKGKWIENDDFICSECGYHMIVGDGAYNFCPNCGAKMGNKDHAVNMMEIVRCKAWG